MMKLVSYLITLLFAVWPLLIAGSEATLMDSHHSRSDGLITKRGTRGLQQNNEVVGSEALALILNTMKASLDNVDDAAMYASMASVYQTLRLFDAETGTWTVPGLEGIGETLLPSSISVSDATLLLDQMAAAASQNEYLMNFLDGRANLDNFALLKSKVETEGARVLPFVISFAMVNQLLTKAVYDDPSLNAVLFDSFTATRDAMGIGSYDLKAFTLIKLVSVEKGIAQFVDVAETDVSRFPLHTDDPEFGGLLAMNIMEAVGHDVGADNENNAKAGTVVGYTMPGTRIQHTPATTKLWNDLYAFWNMAFLANKKHFPVLMAKLLIPQVADYADKPEEYMYNRVLALYVSLNYSIFARYDAQRSGSTTFLDWHDPALLEEMSAASFEAAQQYADLVGWSFDEVDGEELPDKLDLSVVEMEESTTSSATSSRSTMATASCFGLAFALLSCFM